MIRFHAEILTTGVNPYVDVPPGVSEALADYAVAGRVRVEGRLNDIDFQGRLVPTRGGGHRLYVPGGLRSAAPAAVGDTVVVDIEGRMPDDVRPPTDLAKALAATPKAVEGFAALTPSHRRELVRWLEDARTPATRARRAGQVVDRALGRAVRNPGVRTGRPLWTCPECGRSFVTRNMNHSCGTWTVEDSLRGRPPEIRALFDAVHSLVAGFGPVTLVPYRDRIAFMERVRFAGVRPRLRWLDVEFWLPRRVESARLRKVETLSPYVHIHTLRISSIEDVDEELTRWLREAYAVGQQEHLSGMTNAKVSGCGALRLQVGEGCPEWALLTQRRTGGSRGRRPGHRCNRTVCPHR